ncbi:MAG: hypothetical protein Q7S09_01165 [bacterium]|nr:hypothetical protein [bacterium]
MSEFRHNKPQESVHLLVSLNAVSITLAIVSALSYLWLLNLLVSHSYVLKDLGQRLEALHETEEKLNRDVASLRSFEDLSFRISSLGLVASENISYPKSPSAVAQSDGPVVP